MELQDASGRGQSHTPIRALEHAIAQEGSFIPPLQSSRKEVAAAFSFFRNFLPLELVFVRTLLLLLLLVVVVAHSGSRWHVCLHLLIPGTFPGRGLLGKCLGNIKPRLRRFRSRRWKLLPFCSSAELLMTLEEVMSSPSSFIVSSGPGSSSTTMVAVGRRQNRRGMRRDIEMLAMVPTRNMGQYGNPCQAMRVQNELSHCCWSRNAKWLRWLAPRHLHHIHPFA